jgi:MerR family transcriptional regulator/heat shock protein HspR
VYEEINISVKQASDAKVLIISVAARLAGMHPQTLRQYDRLGLVQAGRAGGGGRRYSERIIGLEQMVGDLQQRIAELEQQLEEAYARIAELEAVGAYSGRDGAYSGRDLVRQQPPSTALVVWRPRRGADR